MSEPKKTFTKEELAAKRLAKQAERIAAAKAAADREQKIVDRAYELLTNWKPANEGDVKPGWSDFRDQAAAEVDVPASSPTPEPIQDTPAALVDYADGGAEFIPAKKKGKN